MIQILCLQIHYLLLVILLNIGTLYILNVSHNILHEGRSANYEPWDRAIYHCIVQSQHSLPPQNGPSRACLCKTAALYRLAWRSNCVEKSRKWKAIIMATDGPRGSIGKELNRQIFAVGYLQFVGRKHSVWLGTEIRQWQENLTGGCPWAAQNVQTEDKR